MCPSQSHVTSHTSRVATILVSIVPMSHLAGHEHIQKTVVPTQKFPQLVHAVAMLTSLWLCFLQHLDENSPLGDLLRGVVDVPACQIGELSFLHLESSGVGVSLQLPLLLRRKPLAESLETTLTFWKPQAPLSSPAFTLHA